MHAVLFFASVEMMCRTERVLFWGSVAAFCTLC
jgi:hypothetical protein